MDLDFKSFQREYYAEYASWFADPELNNRLGPMDEEWLDAILSKPESDGETWAIFLKSELVCAISAYTILTNPVSPGRTGEKKRIWHPSKVR